MIGQSLIDHLNREPNPACCRASIQTNLFVGSVRHEAIELVDIAAVTYREHKETGAPISLPMPETGFLRVWMKRSAYNPRALGVRVADEVFCAVVEWPRDYYDLTEDEVVKASGKMELLENVSGVTRAIVANRMLAGVPHVHRTFAVEKGKWGEAFGVYQEFDSVKEALAKFNEIKPDMKPDGEPRPEWGCLTVNGLAGLLETSKGRKLLKAIFEAVEKKLLSKPMKFEAYKQAVKEPLTEVEAGGLINLGVLCSKCPGMTWGEVGFEVMRGITGGSK